MGLVCWLPLNGNLNDNGCGMTTIINSGATVNSSGKIGSCYAFDGTDDYIALAGTKLFNCFKGVNQPFSIAMWVLHADSTRAILFGDYATSGGIGFNIELYESHVVRFYWNSSPDYVPSGMNVGANVWHHIAFTYDGSSIKSYLDGVLCNTRSGALNVLNKTTGEFRLGRDNRTGFTALNGRLNDVRIYDSCLSQAEVHEISQGLVLHYKLDKPANINNNLYVGSEKFTGNWGNSGGWTTSTETYQNFVVKQRSDTWGGLHQNIPCTNGDIFTISFYAKVDSGGQIMSVHRSSLGNVTTGLTILGGNFSSSTNWIITTQDGTQWNRYWATVQIASSDITYLQWRIENNQSGKNLYICGIKLEKGPVATPWSPATSEAGETNIIQDTSGYGHNGATVTPQPLTSNTPRYSAAYTCNGNVSHRIYCNSTDCNFTDNFSFVVWCKANHTGTAAQYLFTVGRADAGGYGYGIYNNGDTNLNIRFGNAGYNVTIVKNEWVHIAFTKTGNTIKIYKNGVIVSTNTFSGTLPTYSDGKGIGLGCFHYASGDIYPAYGALSDFRIYATALSADDIKQLYEVGAKIDNKGKFHTYELAELQNNLLFKTECARIDKVWRDGLSSYTQSNCQVTLTDNGYRIYRPPNLTPAANGNTMWGGLRLNNQSTGGIHEYNISQDNMWLLQPGHTYLIGFHITGKSSNATSFGFTNNMGWGGGGVSPNPTILVNDGIPTDFNGEKDCTCIFTISDTIAKACTSAYSSYTAGTTYLSYRDFTFGWGYTSTGALGTDVYITNLHMYDITSLVTKFEKKGVVKIGDLNERMNDCRLIKNSELCASKFIEI